jgi:hypothetical protein
VQERLLKAEVIAYLKKKKSVLSPRKTDKNQTGTFSTPRSYKADTHGYTKLFRELPQSSSYVIFCRINAQAFPF